MLEVCASSIDWQAGSALRAQTIMKLAPKHVGPAPRVSSPATKSRPFGGPPSRTVFVGCAPDHREIGRLSPVSRASCVDFSAPGSGVASSSAPTGGAIAGELHSIVGTSLDSKPWIAAWVDTVKAGFRSGTVHTLTVRSDAPQVYKKCRSVAMSASAPSDSATSRSDATQEYCLGLSQTLHQPASSPETRNSALSPRWDTCVVCPSRDVAKPCSHCHSVGCASGGLGASARPSAAAPLPADSPVGWACAVSQR
mmetsp:Transcript_99043/g.302812  ORF Transcript_99043/g.302812 Transcript_99043/m.302812 type:complete len:253 (+) Transcript_99043:228-986(+)